MTRKTSKFSRLTLEGPSTVRNAEAVHSQLTGFLKRRRNIEIDCSQVTEIDLTFVQLLIAARKTAHQMGKTLVMSEPATGSLRDVLSQCGLLSKTDGADGDERAFWLNRRESR